MPDKFENLLPEKGFLRDYVEWTRNTEPPTSFHFFTAVAILAGALERNVWIDQGAYKIYPAGWFILVAPTGECRKSSCTRIGIRLLKQALPNLMVIEEKATPEGLLNVLSREVIMNVGGRRREIRQADAVCMIHAPELSILLGRQAYNEGMIVLLTSLIDSPDVFDSVLVKGDRTLKNVAITCLGASNPDWLSSAVPADAHGGGFLSRLLFICESRTNRCFPRPPPLDPEIQQNLDQQLKVAHDLFGIFRLTPEAEQWFDNWYITEGRRHSTIEGLETRRPDHLLRVGLILAISEGSQYLVQPSHLQHALAILTHILQRGEVEVQEITIGDTAYFTVRRILRKKGEMHHSDLIRSCSSRGIQAVVVNQYLDTMLQAGEIRIDTLKSKRGRPHKQYTWLKGDLDE